jgi:prolyl-tRNA synthetase
VVRPTSETIIGDAFSRWVRSHRDLPLLINQWANVVRWEMRPRLFLRTTEFLWQEGHTAHATKEEAVEETMKMLEVYRSFAEDILAMPVIAGEKPENERFPGAEATYSIEAMMQDGKALQAGTSHFLGTHFAEAQGIKFQDDAGTVTLCNTTSWGVSTRLIGGVIMTHGDDDGLRLPPAIAPRQIVVVPMLRDKPEDAEVLAYCESLVAALSSIYVFGHPVRVLLDTKKIKSAEKRWNWVRRGAPIIVEIGPRDAAGGNVTFMRRDSLRDGEKVKSIACTRAEFLEEKAAQILAEIQHSLYAEAKARLDANIKTGVTDWAGVEDYFKGSDDEFKGWLRISWARPTGADLDAIDNKLKTLKLTIRNAPLNQPAEFAPCLFSGKPGVEEILIGRAY